MARITDLPEEVIALVGIHLDKYTIKSAIRTCWHLYNALNHLLWRLLHLPSRTGRLLLSATKIEENAHRIHQLEFRCAVPQEYCSIRFPNVRDITINYSLSGNRSHPTYTVLTEDWDRRVRQLIGLNPQVQDLALYCGKFPVSSAVWNIIFASLQAPKRLKVQSFGVFSDLVDPFWRACLGFEELHLDVREIDCCNSLSTLMFPCLKRLTMTYSSYFRNTAMAVDDYLEWMKNAPNLVALEWSVYDQYFPTDDLIAALAEKTWPLLESFAVLHRSGPDDEWADIISVLPPLKQFRSDSYQFKDLCFARLQKHQFATLRSLHVRDCTSFSSLMTLTVLSECVHLEELQAPYIYVADLKSGSLTCSGWVCSGLRYLKLQVFRDIDDTRTDELVFKQLSKLDQLRELHLDQEPLMAYPAAVRDILKQKGAIQLRLGAGLSHLSTLKRLTDVSFHYTGQSMAAEDVWWMLENWTSLKKMDGTLSEDDGIQDELAQMIYETNVDYWPVDFD
ncbi:hypothetical protein BGZ47_005167 [Haplosporangium gracile]|nr:hypothetical protein BGZ47_005167 [Haplosporangium gracile]